MTDFLAAGSISAQTGWQLLPPPIPTSTLSLASDCDPNWIGYLAPFSPLSLRRAQSYIKYFVPIKSQSLNYVDQWITPGWKDESMADGPVWTNELIHFVLDNCLPTLNDLICKGSELHDAIVKGGLQQRQARLDGRDDRIWGVGLTDTDLPPWIISTITITIEIKRLLPEEGTKWLFLRATTKSLLNNRMDYDIVLTDEHNELIALSHHVLQVIHLDSKAAKKSSL